MKTASMQTKCSGTEKKYTIPLQIFCHRSVHKLFNFVFSTYFKDSKKCEQSSHTPGSNHQRPYLFQRNNKMLWLHLQ